MKQRPKKSTGEKSVDSKPNIISSDKFKHAADKPSFTTRPSKPVIPKK